MLRTRYRCWTSCRRSFHLGRTPKRANEAFLLTGEEAYLEPFANAKSELPDEIRKANDLVENDPVQLQRIKNLDEAVKDKLTELDQTIELRRKGEAAAALAVVRSDRGKVLMDRIRSLVTTMGASERAALSERQDAWQHAEFISSAVTFGGSTVLLVLIGAAALLTSRDFRARQTQVWLAYRPDGLRSANPGRAAPGAARRTRAELPGIVSRGACRRLVHRRGRRDIPPICRIRAGIPGRGRCRPGGRWTLGQAAKENRAVRVQNIPEGYLPITSALGQGAPREILIAPATADGTVHAMVELGFLRTLHAEDLELLDRCPGPWGSPSAPPRIAPVSKSCWKRPSGRAKSCRPSRRSCVSATRSWKSSRAH